MDCWLSMCAWTAGWTDFSPVFPVSPHKDGSLSSTKQGISRYIADFWAQWTAQTVPQCHSCTTDKHTAAQSWGLWACTNYEVRGSRMGPTSSTGSPMTFMMRPKHSGPTGTCVQITRSVSGAKPEAVGQSSTCGRCARAYDGDQCLIGAHAELHGLP